MPRSSWRSALPDRQPERLLERLHARLRGVIRDPMQWTEWLQVVKTVAAAVIAWLLADRVFELPQSFLAPWSALLVVHATVYRTFSRGLRQVAAAVLGVLLAWAVGNLIGLDTVAVSVLLAVGLGIGATRWFADETTAVAATGLIVLTTGFSTHDQVLLDRLFGTFIGIVVGLVVNLIVWPPLRDYSAARAIDAIDDGVGRLLRDMAEELHGPCGEDQVAAWVDRTRDLDQDIDAAWALLRQAKESSRLNPRIAARDHRRSQPARAIAPGLPQREIESHTRAKRYAQPGPHSV